MNSKALAAYVRQAKEPVHVFFYSPTCGNCKTARIRLDKWMANHTDDKKAIESTKKSSVELISCNINSAPNLAIQWQIERIPALICVHNDGVVDKRYDFGSTQALGQWIEAKPIR